MQVYLASIASIRVTLWSGRKPSKHTYERLCCQLRALARESEMMPQLLSLPGAKQSKQV